MFALPLGLPPPPTDSETNESKIVALNAFPAVASPRGYRVANAFVRNRNAIPGTLNLRGFETSNSFATEGVRLSPYKRDMAGYDRLEVVKGPPSAVQGRGGVGGLLNYILKKPEPDKFFVNYSFRTIYDEDSGGQGARATVDLNISLQDHKNISTRIVAVMEDREGQVIKKDSGYGFQYVDWQFDGDDLIAVRRTAWAAHNYHYANFLTFHRIRNFRSLRGMEAPSDLAAGQ